VWFEISFPSGNKLVRFSTGPHTKYTHWKYVNDCLGLPRSVRKSDAYILTQRQTAFYTPEAIPISKDQIIRGQLSCAPNTKNNRGLDIMIAYKTESTEGIEGVEATVKYNMCVSPLLWCRSPYVW
jgi:protein arginine N-methyltransferase 1